ncbi:MAG: DMT family transporter [Pseudomonadota bacterium]|nr:DMT family transporter [Pseudomonadota bacterium]MEC8291971.1 DMT family transporter [Pseudomonadota bacterium]
MTTSQPSTQPTTMTAQSFVLLLCLAAVWGGSFLFAELALREVPPLTITLHRVVCAVPALLLALRLGGLALPRSARFWGGALGMGLLNNAIPFSLIFWGQQQIEAGLASILNGTTAMFGAVVAGLLLPDEPLTPNKLAGAVLGLLGVAVIMGPEALGGFDPANLAQLAVLGAALSYALASVWGKRLLGGHPPLVNATGMLIGASVLMLPVVLLVEGPPRFDLSAGTFGALAGLALLSTSLAYGLYFAILRRAGAANLMLVTLLIPPFAIALGALVLGERIGAAEGMGFAVIALGFVVTDGRLLSRYHRLSQKRGAGS